MKYLKRQIDKELEAWKCSVEHKPLLVRGARQVGKSSAIRHLGESFSYFLEVKSGLRGSMASLYVFMDKEQIKYAIRCSLENFGEFVSPKGKKIIVNPLYAISNLFRV